MRPHLRACPMIHSPEKVCDQFWLHGELVSIERFGNGHINDSFLAVFSQAGTEVRYIMQRINPDVFHDGWAIMENFERVIRHVRSKLGPCPVGTSRGVLSLIPTRDGRFAWEDETGALWRVSPFIERTLSFEVCERPEQAYQAARAFGQLQAWLTDLPGERLHETIPGFHDTPGRVSALERAVAADAVGRVASSRDAIDFALARKSQASRLLDLQRDGKIPERVSHNDAKLGNVLLDSETDEAVCVIDLDTLMPGLTHYDFGDLGRTFLSPTEEDEVDVSRVHVRMEMFSALARGYLEAAGHELWPEEIRQLPFSTQLITYEIGVRFLADHLSGDSYFRTHRPGQNLDRARAQFALVARIEEAEAEMQDCIRDLI